MDVLAQVTLKTTSGIDRDDTTNSFAFTGMADDAGDRADLIEALFEFYNFVPSGGLAALAACISSTIRRTDPAIEVALYDISDALDGSPHGSPLAIGTTGLAAVSAGATPLPDEVAYVLTLEAQNRSDQPVERPDGADPGTAADRPRQRYTGRVYLGPLNTAAVALVDGTARPSAQIRDTANLAAADLVDHVAAITGGPEWCVWSRQDATLRPITHVSGDNAFDTQRRRGVGATVRTRVAV